MIETTKKISGAKIFAVAKKIIIGALMFAGIGYISSVITQKRCEDAEAWSLANDQMKGKPFYVLIGDDPSQTIFERIGAEFTLFTVIRAPDPKSGRKRIRRFVWPDGEAVPNVDAGGRTASVSSVRLGLPFLAAVEHSAFYGSLGADSGISYYLCLFGVPIKVKEEITGMS